MLMKMLSGSMNLGMGAVIRKGMKKLAGSNNLPSSTWQQWHRWNYMVKGILSVKHGGLDFHHSFSHVVCAMISYSK